MRVMNIGVWYTKKKVKIKIGVNISKPPRWHVNTEKDHIL